ncbi:MAG: hypothetical protein E7184_00265 [Erysipelotrichaceae bacterium]|nr:hypothetical protein [Erysipelotrichaceae bacterium]
MFTEKEIKDLIEKNNIELDLKKKHKSYQAIASFKDKDEKGNVTIFSAGFEGSGVDLDSMKLMGFTVEHQINHEKFTHAEFPVIDREDNTYEDAEKGVHIYQDANGRTGCTYKNLKLTQIIDGGFMAAYKEVKCCDFVGKDKKDYSLYVKVGTKSSNIWAIKDENDQGEYCDLNTVKEIVKEKGHNFKKFEKDVKTALYNKDVEKKKSDFDEDHPFSSKSLEEDLPYLLDYKNKLIREEYSELFRYAFHLYEGLKKMKKLSKKEIISLINKHGDRDPLGVKGPKI